MSFFKKYTIFKLLITLSIVITGSLTIAYHTDTYNRSLHANNYRFMQYLGIDLYNQLESIGNALDIKGSTLAQLSPVAKEDKLELIIAQGDLDALLSISKRDHKIWVDGQLKIANETRLVKVKIHGSDGLHFRKEKYSLRVKINKDEDLIKGMRTFNLIIGEEANPTLIAANKIAAEAGLIAPYGRMVNVSVNDKEHGHYYFVEHHSKHYLSKKGIKDYVKIENVIDWDSKERQLYGSNHLSDHALFTGHIETIDHPCFPIALTHYKKMCNALKESNTADFMAYFDAHYIGNYLAVLSLFNENHQCTGDNLKLFFDLDTKKFYPLYRQEYGYRDLDWRIYNRDDLWFNSFPNFNKLVFERSLQMHANATNAQILKSLLSIDSVRHYRDIKLWDFVQQRAGLADSLNATYLANKAVMLNANVSRRAYYFEQQGQIGLMNSILNMADQYINYAHVYGSRNTSTSSTELAIDAFVKMNVNQGSFNQSQYGIQFNDQLDIQYKYLETYQLGPITITNCITGDTVPDHYIFLNQY